MAVYTLIIWSVALVVLSPLTSWMLNRLVARSGNMVVGNTELIAWLMSPAGLLALTLWGMLALLGVVLEVTGLIWIAAGDAHKGLRSAKQALQQLLPALPNLLNFCLSVFLLCVMVLLPLVAGLAGVYRVFISQYDINYYLTARPAQWWWALACGAAWLLVWAAAAVGLLLRWLYAFPLWLEGVRPFRSTLRASWQATRRSYLFLLRTMGMCLACVILGRVVLESGLIAATGLVLRQQADAVAA